MPSGETQLDRSWIVRLRGFSDDAVVEAPTRSAARYRCWKMAREAGYFDRRDGFRKFLDSLLVTREVKRAER